MKSSSFDEMSVNISNKLRGQLFIILINEKVQSWQECNDTNQTVLG